MAAHEVLVNTLRDALISHGKLISDKDPENAKKNCKVLFSELYPYMTKERFEKMYARICGIQEKYNIPRTPENVKAAKNCRRTFWHYFSRIRCQQLLRRRRR